VWEEKVHASEMKRGAASWLEKGGGGSAAQTCKESGWGERRKHWVVIRSPDYLPPKKGG